ncbi:MAG TPA: hypothetical protein VFH95_04570 [Candidatus Kapabacteria bacterium]|nr:hypothetical protein [Candidatus Kapabacteria bacterium]
MKRLVVILAFFAAGCAQNLTAPLNSVPVTSMAEYFWTAGTTETLNSDIITTRDSGGVLLADDSNPSGAFQTTLVCRVSADSVVAEGFIDSSLIDLDPYTYFIEGDTNAPLPRHPGGVVLLRSNPLVDSSWRAGTIGRYSSPNEKPFPVEARLLERLDTLNVNGVSYPDVLVIRYAHELADFSADSTKPYWVIFYARGRGPIMFDKVKGTLFERRAILP